jgi:hypothetical protein
LYLAAKLSSFPQSPRNVINAFEVVISTPSLLQLGTKLESPGYDAYIVSEGTYIARRNVMMKMEARILHTCGFQTHVALPYTLVVNYLQALDALKGAKGEKAVARAFQHLNSALLSSQLLYLTFQPSALATAAIYLASRESGVRLPEVEWWEVFDVDREELGFLVVAMCSMPGFVEAEKNTWSTQGPPLTIADLEKELARRRNEDTLNTEDSDMV